MILHSKVSLVFVILDFSLSGSLYQPRLDDINSKLTPLLDISRNRPLPNIWYCPLVDSYTLSFLCCKKWWHDYNMQSVCEFVFPHSFKLTPLHVLSMTSIFLYLLWTSIFTSGSLAAVEMKEMVRSFWVQSDVNTSPSKQNSYAQFS